MMEPNSLFEELQKSKEDIVLFRKLINFASLRNQTLDDENLKEWQPVLESIIQIFIPNKEINRERTLLASHAFFAVLSMRSTFDSLKETLYYFLKFNSNQLHYLNKIYNITECDLFKLTCTYGYLQVNRKEIYTNDVCSIMFDVIHRHCIQYTRHSYFAYKVLYIWLQRTMNTDFWNTCDVTLEHKLEAIIFSNWCNAINEISKQNSASIFNIYLRIMSRKYEKFLEYMFQHCVDNISWHNEIKYVILAEICEVWDNVRAITSRDFLLSLSTCLSKYYLRSAGTRVYTVILKKLSEDEWKESFGGIMKLLFCYWAKEENVNYSALQLLCKSWLEPVVKRYKNILLYLWELTGELNGYYLLSHLQRMAIEMHIELPQEIEVEYYVNHKEEIIRLNGFAISCQRINNVFYATNRDQFLVIRNFLFHNANSTTVHMRDGTIRYFKIFYANALKLCETLPDSTEDVYYITHWLHEFLLDCFEIGSCYQRKILALNLYKAMLSFTDGSTFNKSNGMENISYTLLLQKHLKESGHWKFTDKRSLFALLKLVLDSALDIKQLATSIILNYFDRNLLTDQEKEVLFCAALENCNSSKFYKIESGSALMIILTTWMPLNTFRDTTFAKIDHDGVKSCSKYSEFLFNEAKRQLAQMKEDILKAIVQKKPFYGVLTALLSAAFRNGPESQSLTLEFAERILNVLKEATDFFLSILSSKSANTEYSSSFAEMGLAIDDAIKNSEIDDANYDELNLTPAHQVLVSCIWLSLKVSCEIACEIGSLMYSDETVKASANIIVAVLFRCRHKGAVEAAGVAIGNLTRSLCKKNEYCELPRMYVLNILKNDTMHSLNITRRSAGLSIMFHKIVVSDNRRDRPLLHYAVQMLLNLLGDFSEASSRIVESQHDSPWARRLHFLRALVADKEIQAQLIPYMERISLICFKYLESEVWTIRNASLQLFGVIVPRLAGQSYGDASLDFGTGYAIDHFVTHYPVLADYTMKQLEHFSSNFANFSTALYLHSNIVHTLILLSKFSSSGCDLIDYSSQEFILKSKRLLRPLFSDPVLYVRQLAAKVYAALTPSLCIGKEIEELKRDMLSTRKANLIHGYLLTIKYLKERMSVETNDVASFIKVTQCRNYESKECMELSRYRDVLQTWNNNSKVTKIQQPCYVIETLILQLSECLSNQTFITDLISFDQTTMSLSQKIQPGFFNFVDHCTKLYADYLRRSNNVNIDIIRRILDSHTDQCIAFLNYLSHFVPIVEIIINRLLSNTINESVLKAMVNFVLNTLKHSLLNAKKLCIKELIENLDTKTDALHSDLWRLKSILTIMFSDNEAIINDILSHILSISVHEEEYMRQLAVEFMQFSAHRFMELTVRNKLTIVHCCLILLKDEIAEIRETIAESIRMFILPKINSTYNNLQHDEVIYQKLLSLTMLRDTEILLPSKEKNLEFIKLFTQSIKNLDINVTIENPFYHDDSPFYREESKFLNICFYFIRQNDGYKFDKRRSENSVGYNEGVDDLSKIQARYELQKMARFDYTNLETMLNVRYVDYLLRKQGIVIQEYN